MNQNVYDILNCNPTSCYHGNIRPALSVSSNQEVAFLKLQSTKTKCLFILGQHDLQTTTFYTFKHRTTLFIHLSKIFLRFFSSNTHTIPCWIRRGANGRMTAPRRLSLQQLVLLAADLTAIKVLCAVASDYWRWILLPRSLTAFIFHEPKAILQHKC